MPLSATPITFMVEVCFFGGMSVRLLKIGLLGCESESLSATVTVSKKKNQNADTQKDILQGDSALMQLFMSITGHSSMHPVYALTGHNK